MRTYAKDSNGDWQTITDTDLVWITTLGQTLGMNLGESPFYANFGVAALASIEEQNAPDTSINNTITQYQQYFTQIVASRENINNQPIYKITAITLSGKLINTDFIFN